jgi:hypothetical protein
MRAVDFSAWLSAIAGLSARQRREALEAASGEGGQARSGPEVSLEAPWQGDEARPPRGRAPNNQS